MAGSKEFPTKKIKRIPITLQQCTLHTVHWKSMQEINKQLVYRGNSCKEETYFKMMQAAEAPNDATLSNLDQNDIFKRYY